MKKKKKNPRQGLQPRVGAGCWRVVGSSRPGFPSPWVHLDKANWMRQSNTLCKWFFWSYASSPDLRGTVMVVLWGSHQRCCPSDRGMPREQGCLPASLLSFTLTTHCLHIFHSLWAENRSRTICPAPKAVYSHRNTLSNQAPCGRAHGRLVLLSGLHSSPSWQCCPGHF